MSVNLGRLGYKEENADQLESGEEYDTERDSEGVEGTQN